MGRRGLQIFLTVLGTVALVAGAASVLSGAYSVPEHGDIVASVDSELRFYAAWYVAAGVLVLRAVRKVETEGTLLRVVAAAFFIAGCGRLISLAIVGRPHGTQLVLMVIELVLPLVIVPWQSSVARQRV